jgi:hypothetical protein
MKRTFIVRRIFRSLMVIGIVGSLAGCSTVSGFADFVGGAARDLKDVSEGSREKSGSMGGWSGVYGSRN